MKQLPRLAAVGLVVGVLASLPCVGSGTLSTETDGRGAHTKHHTNWAVIVSTSRFWYNYRHTANALSVYRTLKRLGGIPDSNIILMLADDHACDPRNRYPATVINSAATSLQLYGDDMQVDYRGYEVSAENLFRLLTGRHDDTVPMSKRLLSDENSNILVYMTGHGGVDFLKFQDTETISSTELGDSFHQMYRKKRYKQLLLIMETCHAESMLSGLHSPRLIGLASSATDEESVSVARSAEIGVFLIDAFTARLLQFLEPLSSDSTKSLLDLVRYSGVRHVRSTVKVRSTIDIAKVRLMDFLSGQPRVVVGRQQGWGVFESKDPLSQMSDGTEVRKRQKKEESTEALCDQANHPSTTGAMAVRCVGAASLVAYLAWLLAG